MSLRIMLLGSKFLVSSSAFGVLNKARRRRSSTVSAAQLAVEKKKNTLKSFGEIPGPKGLPLFGTALHYLMNWDGLSFDTLFEAYRRRSDKYGPIFQENFGGRIIVIVTDFKEYGKVMRADGKSPRRIPLEPLLHYRLQKGLCPGMVNGNGEGWQKYRSSVNKKMLQPKEVAEYFDMMDAVALDMVKLMDQSRDIYGVVHDINDVLFRWSMESVNTFLMDTRLGSLDPIPSEKTQAIVYNIVGVFRCMQKLMFDLPVYKYVKTPMWHKFEEHCEKAIGIGLEVVNERLKDLAEHKASDEESERECLISYLLKKKELNHLEISALLVELMVGSVETASNTLMWCLYLLAKNPSIQQQLYDSIDDTVGHKQQLTINDINNMPLVKACIKESLRMYPVTFATSRVLNEDLEICGYHVPAGTHVQANTCALSRDPTVFPQPDQFLPDRWLNKSTEGGMAAALLVWGHGARMCIGRRLAEQELHLGLVRLMQRYEVLYDNDIDPIPVLHTVMTSAKPMSLKFVDRY